MKTPMKIIDLRPPYPWEKQPDKPKEDGVLEYAAAALSLFSILWVLMMLVPALF